MVTFAASAQVDLGYYLPEDSYNPQIPTPASVIGHDVGEWHITHDKLVQYMHALAEQSDRIEIQETGRTFEGRPLLILTITSENNHQQLENIRTEHLKLTDPSSTVNIENMPVIVYMGFSIHGNEASGSNASLLTAYYLAASNSPEILNILENTIILFDPSFNPDGLQRFASWVNSRKSQVLSPDPQNHEQNEPWPRGRTNHYWFDLNRDWLPAQLPESQARLKTFHNWKPNVLTDHHEMGTNSTFFFQPGIPSRNNPLTPPRTFELTEEIAKFHAKALDSIGSLYYTKESYDDFYYGKGSTYPDINGGIGILFEQASSRGHLQESENGLLSFPFTIKNQFNTTLSTLRAANALRGDLLRHQREFYESALDMAGGNAGGFTVGSNDPWMVHDFAKFLERHKIEFYQTNAEVNINGNKFESGKALFVPLSQPQHRLINSIFEKRTTFTDSLFYDVSAWNIPMAFNMAFRRTSGKEISGLSLDDPDLTPPAGDVNGGQATYAYAIEWNNYYSPAVLNNLLNQGIRVRVATAPFIGSNGKSYQRGTLIVPVHGQDEVHEVIENALDKFGVKGDALNSGLDFVGKSLGSPSFENIEKRKIAMLVSGGVNSYEAGEVWHLFDERMKIPLTLLPVDRLGRSDLSHYNTLIMVDGNYGTISNGTKEKMKDWVRNGGVLIVVKDAISFVKAAGLGNFDFRNNTEEDSIRQKSYADISAERGANQLGGAIFEARIDLTHPLFYGFDRDRIALFKNDRLFMKPSKNGFANPAIYTEDPVLSGYISKDNLELLKGSSAMGMSRFGSGRVIAFTNDLNFRAFWRGTNRIFLNAIFFAPIISSSAAR